MAPWITPDVRWRRSSRIGRKEILVITGIGSTPCPLEGLKSTLDSITLNEMSFGPEKELFIDAKGV